MTRRLVWAAMAVAVGAVCAACTSNAQQITGRVHGIWNLADGLALRLQSDHVDALLVVPVDGAFRFAPPLLPGASYTVVVAASPAMHTCAIESGGNGVVGDREVSPVVVGCAGPAGIVALSGDGEWQFDPTQGEQTFDASIFAGDVTLTISGPGLTRALVNGRPTPLGQPTAAIALAPGSSTVTLVLSAGRLSKTYVLAFHRGAGRVQQAVYGKPSIPGAGYQFGQAIALDRDTLVVGAPGETVTLPGDMGELGGAGAIYVFTRSAGAWSQQARLISPNPHAMQAFGSSVAVSGDTLAVGAPGDNSPATGIDSDPLGDSAPRAGAAYVFVRSGATWTRDAYIKASNTGYFDSFGGSIALSGDTLVVGAPGENSGVAGVDSPGQADDSAPAAGAVYVFQRTAARWAQQSYIKASNPFTNDLFGTAIALSGDTLAVGAPFESSAATGIDGVQADRSAPFAGAAYVFARSAGTWRQQAYVKASNTADSARFGGAVALSGDTLAVGAARETSRSKGVDGDQRLQPGFDSGAVYVFGRSAATWRQQAYVKASNTDVAQSFGASVALAGDILAVGATDEASSTVADQASHAAVRSGAGYLFNRVAGAWQQTNYVKASNPDIDDQLGTVIAVSADLVVFGAPGEASRASGVNPADGATDNGAPKAGAVYLFR